MNLSANKALSRTIIILAVLAATAFFALYAYTHRPLDRISDDLRDDETINFFALGDQGSGEIKQWEVARAMEKLAETQRDLDFVVLMGDNFYVKNELTLDSPDWMSKFEHVYAGKYLNAAPFYAVLGNHDYGKSDGAEDDESHSSKKHAKAKQNPEVQLEYASKHMGSNRWRMPAHYYSADFGSVQGQILLRMVFLDTNLPHDELLKEADFIRKQFSASSGKTVWKIVVAHHPVRTYGKHFGEMQEIEETLLPALKDTHVDLYLSGHDHNQQVIAGDGEPVYVVSGGGGSRLYDIRRQSPDLKFSRAAAGFVNVSVDKAALNFSIRYADGTAAASYRIDRNCGQARASCLQPAL